MKPRGEMIVSAARDAVPARTQAEVLRAAVAGESWAHAALYKALYPIVARALQKILHETVDYEDLVQTSFELIVRALQKPNAREIENLAGFSSAIAARVAMNWLGARIRERRIFDRHAEVSNAAGSVPGPRLDRTLDARSDLFLLQSTLMMLSEEQAETVLLHDVLGYETKEVAWLTGVSSATAQRRLSRGRAQLKKRAEELGNKRR